MTAPRPIACGLALVLLACAAAAQGANGPAEQGDYPDLEWELRRDLRNVRDVICHPTDPRVVWLVAPEGLSRSDDGGKTFQPVPSATAEKVGEVTALEVCPADGDRMVLGTNADGMFLSLDAGKSWRGMSTTSEPLADLHVECIRFCTADPSFRTVLASHGAAAPGLSLTRDLGAHWEVLGRGRYVGQFVKHGETIVAAASEAGSEGRVWGIHRSGTDGQRWEVCNRGIRPTEGVYVGSWRYLFATLDGDVLESSNDGRTWYPIFQAPRAGWVSLLLTHGRTANARLMGLYDPKRHGLVLSTRRFADGARVKANHGLYVGPFVRTGAACRANANGSAYFACMNNALWVARRRPPAGGPALEDVRCRPAAAWVGESGLSHAREALHAHVARIAAGSVAGEDVRGIAGAYGKIQDHVRSMGFTVEARVDHPQGLKAIKAVAVDATGFDGAGLLALHDDGKHEDGAAGDGVFAAAVRFSTAVFDHTRRRTWPLPGKTAVTVTATDRAGKTDSWSAAVSIFGRPGPILLWGWGRGQWARYWREGPATSAGRERDTGVQPRTDALSFGSDQPGPWRATWFWADGGNNIAGHETLSFHIRGNVNQEVLVQLVDHHKIGIDVFDQPNYGEPIGLIGGGHLKAITPQYQEVRIPVRELLPEGRYFLRMHCAGMSVSVPEGGKPGHYYVDLVKFDP